MRAIYFEEFGKKPTIEHLPDPEVEPQGTIVKVEASGICRSDWHGWMGHDADIHLPHVPGHELAGTVVETGKAVKKWKKGDQITVPFSCGCGDCRQCLSGNQQVCDHYFQPGFTAWGSFAQLVHIRFADINLVRLPGTLSFTEATILGCRFGTSFRGLIDQAGLRAGQSVVVFGCGGVGLSAIAIAKAAGAIVVAVDIRDEALKKAKELKADHCLLFSEELELVPHIRDLTNGGANISLDAIGDPRITTISIYSLAKRGKHIQVGLLTGDGHFSPVNMDLVISRELEIIGSHGIQSYRYTDMLEFIEAKQLNLKTLIQKEVNLKEAIDVLMKMGENKHSGISVITDFD